MSEAQNCKACKHARWELTKSGKRIARDAPGQCTAEPLVQITLPHSIKPALARRVPVWPEDGEGCPLWAKRGPGFLPSQGVNFGPIDLQEAAAE